MLTPEPLGLSPTLTGRVRRWTDCFRDGYTGAGFVTTMERDAIWREQRRKIADFYARFSEHEARGSSPVYEDWANSIATDPAILALLDELPGMKVQPNLVFAAARLLGAPVGPFAPFREWLLHNWSRVTRVVLERMTQTNEAGRCAELLPTLTRIPGPTALIEVDASAGLGLYPDRYSYRYDTGNATTALDPADGPSDVILSCRIDAPSVPDHLPDVVSRAGIDLSPIDVRHLTELEWLETLVWPEHDERRRRLRAAAQLVAADPPVLLQGDLLEEVSGVVALAPRDATVVVFHSAVLVYVDPDERRKFIDLMTRLTDVEWISNEGEHVIPSVAAQLPQLPAGRTVLARNGRPVALVGPHGQSFESL
ncbi:MAG: hypothetical protein JWP75_438 [Frondihabitans sp.]|nr:hypothetical protein [Frondihabitans sp.]